MDKKKPVAVISGGSRGIGRAIVEKFLEEGFEVFTCSRNINPLSSLVEDLGLNALSVDLSKKKEVEKFGQYVLNKASKIDVLVNNTGVFIPGQIHLEEDNVFETQINTNLASTYHLTRMFTPLFIKQKQGYIFNICSTASITPYLNGGSYCISKYAQYGLTKVLREEMKAYYVKVSAVLPGATLTSSWEGSDLPKERFIDPKTIAEMIYFHFNVSDSSVVEDIVLRPLAGDV